MLPQEVRDYLTDQGHPDARPELGEGPDDMIAIIEYPGSEPWRTKGSGDPTEAPRFQVFVRCPGSQYAAGRQEIEDIYRELDGFSGVLNGTAYSLIRALQSPYQLPRDENGRWRFACNFEAIKARS